MAGERQVRTPERRRADEARNVITAQLHGQDRGGADGVFMPSEDYPYVVVVPFGKAAFLAGSLTPIGSEGVFVPSQIDVDFSRDRTAPIRKLKVEVRQGIPECTEIHLAARPEGRGLRPSDLEAIDLTNWIEDILWECARQETPDGFVSVAGERNSRKAILHARKAARRKVTPELLQRVADLYKTHINAKPIEAVREEFDVSYRTAARYVEMCRSDEYQLLPKTGKGKRKA
jgi:hypothetical protein